MRRAWLERLCGAPPSGRRGGFLPITASLPYPRRWSGCLRLGEVGEGGDKMAQGGGVRHGLSPRLRPASEVKSGRVEGAGVARLEGGWGRLLLLQGAAHAVRPAEGSAGSRPAGRRTRFSFLR